MIQIKKYRVSEDYELKQPPIGKGTFGSVYKAINRQSKVFRAVKRIAIQ